MEEENKKEYRNRKRILFLIFLLALTTVIVLVGTYAWFIGTTTVNTGSFNIKVSAIETIDLSLDGENWTNTTLTISKDAILGNDAPDVVYKAYSGNKNKWITEGGLYPISSAGDANHDSDEGRLSLFIKSSITATRGGYRFKADKIDNRVLEQDGYVAFDLFIRNGMGDSYNDTFLESDNEAIYLTRNSSVTSIQVGADSEDFGIANSIRVAIMEVGRVKWNSDVSDIVNIDCNDEGNNIGLCFRMDPVIWEPNNLKHNSNLISYYNDVCRVRNGLESYQSSIGYSCESVVDGEDSDTYVVKSAIPSNQRADIYDGHNYYYDSSGLENIETFTDSRKMLKEENRDPFIYLALNSVTKLRVYVYLEGQDVDNNTLATFDDNRVEINFGFAKDLFSTEDAAGGATPSLSDYSWEKIKSISDQLVTGLITYDGMVSKYGIEIGQTKKATINGELHTFRLIDVLHDIDAEGNTLGMTFEQSDLMNSLYNFNSSSMSTNDGWNNSLIKTTINNFTIESELDAVITPAKKKSITSVSDSTIIDVTSKLWLISAKEIVNSNVGYGDVGEGTPYKYYTDLNYSSASMIKLYQGSGGNYWTRTPYKWNTRTWFDPDRSNFITIMSIGSINNAGSGNNVGGVSVCFCI